MSLSTLTERTGVPQLPREPRRRWFQSSEEDLIVWYAADGTFYGFQFCYDRGTSERVLTWRQDQGYAHAKVDDGEAVGLAHKRTPMLVPDGLISRAELLRRFVPIASNLPSDIAHFVQDKLEAYKGGSEDT